MESKNRPKFIIGIDEVGRGPLAGPVSVCALGCLPEVLEDFRDIKNSKALSSKKREEWFEKIDIKRKEGAILCSVVSLDNKSIDKIGISRSIKKCLDQAIFNLKIDPANAQILLDGGLVAPDVFLKQTTIIKGDEKETVIAMASVVAKVVRDRNMERLDLQYPGYGFAKHKGYGTKEHCEAIKKLGLSNIHRKSFCNNIFNKIKTPAEKGGV